MNFEIFSYVAIGCFRQEIENITWPHGGKIIGPRCFVSRLKTVLNSAGAAEGLIEINIKEKGSFPVTLK